MRSLLIMICFSFTNVVAQKKWPLATQTWTFHKHTLLETIDKADSLGIQYLEAFPGQLVGNGYNGKFTYTLSADERARLKTHLKNKGINIVAMGVLDKWFYNADNLEKFFVFANEMGISFITAEPEWADLDRFNELAEKYKVKVGLHCHPKPESHYWQPDSMRVALQCRRYIGAWPDIGHWARSGVNIQQGIKKLKKKMWGMHFKDVQQFDNIKTADTFFGEGVCNLPAVIKQLKKMNFKGVITMEYEVYENNMPAMYKNRRYVENLLMRWYPKFAVAFLEKF
jgi:sugar phosphate isomerase/epimerase